MSARRGAASVPRSERAAGAHAAAGSEVILLPHLPKCAGTTIERHLALHLGREGFWSPPKRSRRVPLALFARKYDPALPGAPGAVRAVSGHFIGRSVERLFAGRTVWRGLVLRDPARLVLSWYNYRMMRYRAQGRAAYAFGVHVRSLPPDPVAHFLLERWLELPWWRLATLPTAEKRARLDAALATFDRVVDIGQADALLAEAAARLGIPAGTGRDNTAGQWSAAVAWEPLRPEAVGPADSALLERRTRLDSYLWRRWALGERDAALDLGAVAPFLASELSRPLAEIRRRAARGGAAGRA
jgi:hypothetical protein